MFSINSPFYYLMDITFTFYVFKIVDHKIEIDMERQSIKQSDIKI